MSTNNTEERESEKSSEEFKISSSERIRALEVEIKECVKEKDLEKVRSSVFKWLAGIFATAFISMLALIITPFFDSNQS